MANFSKKESKKERKKERKNERKKNAHLVEAEIIICRSQLLTSYYTCMYINPLENPTAPPVRLFPIKVLAAVPEYSMIKLLPGCL